MADKKNRNEKKKKFLIFLGFIVLCCVVFLGRQMYGNMKLSERCKRGMVPICHHGEKPVSLSVNRTGNACNRFDWYEPQTEFEVCPSLENKEILEGRK